MLTQTLSHSIPERDGPGHDPLLGLELDRPAGGALRLPPDRRAEAQPRGQLLGGQQVLHRAEAQVRPGLQRGVGTGKAKFISWASF